MNPPAGSLPVLERRKTRCFMCGMIARTMKDGELHDVVDPLDQVVFPVSGQVKHLEGEIAMDRSPEWQETFRLLYGDSQDSATSS